MNGFQGAALSFLLGLFLYFMLSQFGQTLNAKPVTLFVSHYPENVDELDALFTDMYFDEYRKINGHLMRLENELTRNKERAAEAKRNLDKLEPQLAEIKRTYHQALEELSNEQNSYSQDFGVAVIESPRFHNCTTNECQALTQEMSQAEAELSRIINRVEHETLVYEDSVVKLVDAEMQTEDAYSKQAALHIEKYNATALTKQILAESLGDIKFRLDEEAVEFDSVVFAVLSIEKLNLDDINARFESSTNTFVNRIKVSNKMKARIHPGLFTVQSNPESELSTDQSSKIEWVWQLHAGKEADSFTVAASLWNLVETKSGRSTYVAKPHKPLSIDVSVKRTFWQSVKEIHNSPLAWLITVIITAIPVCFSLRKTGKKNHEV